MEDFRFDQVRYLAAKRTVDDRALNRHVWDSLLDQLAHRSVAGAGTDGRVRIVELGAGIGTMVERLLDWGLFDALTRDGGGHPAVTVELVDSEAASLAAARARLPGAVRARGWAVSATPSVLRLSRPDRDGGVELRLVEAGVYDYRAERRGGETDLLLANAFFDLFDLDEVVPPLLELLRPGGLGWFTINFDGETIIEPELDDPVDRQVRELYHRAMDERVIDGRRSGDARAGRHLFHRLGAAGVEVLDLGSSDWVVFPRGGCYPADEAYFLRCILATIGAALADDPRLPAGALDDWLRRRHQQVDEGELVYLAHQLDVLARR